MFHFFEKDISQIALPEKFTCPFCYEPHLLSILAANQLQRYIATQENWLEELQNGKMFGVLVAKNKQKQIGFVAAFSGQIQGKNIHEYFVPPVYDLTAENCFFKQEDAEITRINREIEQLEQNECFSLFEKQLLRNDERISLEKQKLQDFKNRRDAVRKTTSDVNVLEKLIRESQFQKAEYKRLIKSLNEDLQVIKSECDVVLEKVRVLREKRHRMSGDLQRKIFEHFVFLNANGDEKNAIELFGDVLPPAGAGECAAPRLLQYAYKNDLQPLAMAEFWWGNSPKDHIRRHGNYYRACKQKCEPILNFMLRGLTVEPNRFSESFDLNSQIEILYEDDAIVVVNKPIDVLSVPGNIPQPSIYNWAKEIYGEVFVVHRLDMATSGILIVAKTIEACKKLQRQFEKREIKKKYIALLDGIVQKQTRGVISLPLRPDFNERPVQVVDYERGKDSVTKYEVLSNDDKKTLVAFYPQTGRTHQLRVHSAHQDGLNCPIVGDGLYGKSADRLYLHATEISFHHPITNVQMTIHCNVDWKI